MPRYHRIPHSSLRGFTLMETAIVMGVMAMVFATVWASGVSISRGAKVRNMHTDALNIVNNVHALYSGVSAATGMTGANTTENTSKLVTSGIFPTSLVNASDSLPYDVWGGRIKTYPGATANYFRLTFDNVPDKATCIQLLSSFLGSAGLNGLYVSGTWTGINTNSTGYTVTAALTPKTIATNGCAAGTATGTYIAGAEFSLDDQSN